MQFAPAIRPELCRLIERLDDGTCPIAQIWRDAGYRARRGNLLQPSYESVRRLVHVQRRRRQCGHSRLKRAAVLAWELISGLRDRRLVVLDMITGDDIRRRPHLYARRPRDELLRAA